MAILETNILYFLSRPLSNERVHAHEDLIGRISPDAENIPEVKKELDDYKKAVEKVSLVFKHSPKSPETLHIAKLDVRRGTLWRGGKQLIKIALDSADADTRLAAGDLSILVNNTYGDVPHFSLYGETGSLKHAIADFRTTENQPKVALINGLTGIVNELDTVNIELETFYHKRFQEVEAVKQLGKLTDTLKQADKLLVALFQALNTVYDYNARTAKLPALKEAIERIATYVEALFDQLKRILDHHKPGGNHHKPGGDGDGEEGEDGDGEDGDGEDGGDGYETPDITNPEVPFE